MCVNKLSTGCFTRKRTFLMNPLVILTTAGNQTSANWGPDSRFVLEAIFRALISMSIRSLIMNTTDLRFPAQLELAQVTEKLIKTRSCIHRRFFIRSRCSLFSTPHNTCTHCKPSGKPSGMQTCMQTAGVKKREQLPTEKERGDPSSSSRALEKN